MPTRKQRRRRAKEQRHEWEYVVYDDEGREVEVDPSELRKDKEQQDGTKARAASRNGKAAAKPRDRKGRPLRPQKPPSWRRAATRAGIFAVALLVFTSLLNQNNTQWAGRIAITVGYGIIAVPFFYFMDRATYRRYLRAAGREDELKPRR